MKKLKANNVEQIEEEAVEEETDFLWMVSESVEGGFQPTLILFRR